MRPTLKYQGWVDKPTVYFAGKIDRLDWRHRILGDNRAGGVLYDAKEMWDPDHVEDYGSIFYGGPFFVSCDHGCGHALYAHGNNSDVNMEAYDPRALEQLHAKVYNINLARMRRADLVFAYVDEGDCYGTMVEIGMAAAWGKPLVTGFGHRREVYNHVSKKWGHAGLPDTTFADMWMLREPALRVYRGAPELTWKSFCAEFGIRHTLKRAA
jgi:Nucleoside 2-deoxyribosyltransferase